MMIDILSNFTIEHNILLGLCDAEPLFSCSELIDIPFSHYSMEQRTTPKLFLDSANSIFVIGVGYGKKFNFLDDEKSRGLLSQSAIGEDYHQVVAKKLLLLDETLRAYANKNNIGYDSRVHVDSGPLPERLLAVKAGLGFIGKNRNIISEKFGSLFNIGCLLTSLPYFELHNHKTLKNCGSCTRCIDACPGQALDAGFDYKKCISFLTQSKGDLTKEQMKKMTNHLYGCDICQNVCPYNLKKAVYEITDIELAKPQLESFFELTKDQFRETYENTAIYWRGHKVLKRNAMIAMENERPRERRQMHKQACTFGSCFHENND